MTQKPTNAAGPTTLESPGTEEMLRRILTAVEGNKRRGWLELALAIILSLATLCSTWCGFQSSRWGGVQNSSQAAADTAERQAAEDTIVGLQIRTFDGIMLLEYWRALRQNDPVAKDVLYARMRPVLQAAVTAAINAGLLKDPTVAGPLQRPEYVLEQETQAARLRAEAHALQKTAKDAGRVSSSYVIMTLLFASILFFGGITGTFSARPVRVGLGFVALVLFVIAIVILAGLPVAGA